MGRNGVEAEGRRAVPAEMFEVKVLTDGCGQGSEEVKQEAGEAQMAGDAEDQKKRQRGHRSCCSTPGRHGTGGKGSTQWWNCRGRPRLRRGGGQVVACGGRWENRKRWHALVQRTKLKE